MQKSLGRLEETTLKGHRKRLSDYVNAVQGNAPADEVRPNDLIEITERASKKSLHLAKLVLGIQKAIFAHGIGRHIIDADPALQLRSNAVLGPRPVARTRVMLSEAELKIILPLLPKMGIQNALMAKILLCTAVRIEELVGAKWENVDLEQRTWFIPPTDIKGKKGRARARLLRASEPVVSWFQDLKDLAFESAYVLPIRSRKKAIGDAHVEPVTINAAFSKFWKTYLAEKCQRFTPHDLCSTARSHLGRL